MKTGLRPRERPVFSKVLLKSLARSLKFYLQTLSPALMVFVFRKPRFLLHSLIPGLMKTGLRRTERPVFFKSPFKKPCQEHIFSLQTLSPALMIFVFRKPRFFLHSLIPGLMKIKISPQEAPSFFKSPFKKPCQEHKFFAPFPYPTVHCANHYRARL